MKKYLSKIIPQLFEKKPTVEAFLASWKKYPDSHFFSQTDTALEWVTGYGLGIMEGLPDTHGFSKMPNIICNYSENNYSLDIGWIERISMLSGGTVRIKHFALNKGLTGRGYGIAFIESLICFFKKHNATSIEFHENHSTKIQHYRQLFKKMGVSEIRSGVWRIDLYPDEEIPHSVKAFQDSLTKKIKVPS